MKPLQNYIEEEIKFLKDKLYGECPDYHDPATHFNFKSNWVEKMIKVEDFDKEVSQSLHRIAEITAKEIVPEPPPNPAFYETATQSGYDEGFNKALSDLQTKIKEFGI